MSVREAEEAAKQLLGPAPTLPIYPDQIARSLGIAVRYAGLPPDQSGKILIPPNGAPVITINEYDHPNRQRFTCAHEIGHYHQRRARDTGPTTFVDYRDTLAGLGSEPDEIFANQFAAALLMPARLVAQYWREGRGVESLAEMFGTSVQAMNLRLRNLGLL
jgi:Zn-dependent peptidase ImmA (M78 family)